MAWTRTYRGNRSGQHRVDWRGQRGDALTFGVRVPSDWATDYTWRAQVRDRPEDAVIVDTFAVDTSGLPDDPAGRTTIMFELDTAALLAGETLHYDVEYTPPDAVGPTTPLGGIIKPVQDVTRDAS